MCKNDIYTIEINSKEYSGANSKFYLDIQGRFPELVGKTVIVKPNFYQLTNLSVLPDVYYLNSSDTPTSTAGYLIRSNLYNEKSFSKSGASSNVLMPLAMYANSFYDYSFEAVMPNQLEVWSTVYSSNNFNNTEQIMNIQASERLIVSFTIMEKDTE